MITAIAINSLKKYKKKYLTDSKRISDSSDKVECTVHWILKKTIFLQTKSSRAVIKVMSIVDSRYLRK